MNNILSSDQVKAIKECGKILSFAMDKVVKAVNPGVSTLELDRIAESTIREKSAEPSFKNFEVVGVGIYPASLCVSVNEEIVHGIPTQTRILNEGDIVSLDLGARFKGVCTDMATTVAVGAVSKEAQRLMDVTRECLKRGINQAKAGNRIGAIGEAVQKYAESNGFGVVRDMVGHGIGIKPHMDPKIPNYGKSKNGPKIVENMALAIEPMVTAGNYNIDVLPDGWTITTKDGSLAAHFEHTVIIENGLPTIVTN